MLTIAKQDITRDIMATVAQRQENLPRVREDREARMAPNIKNREVRPRGKAHPDKPVPHPDP
jgi:hypothetical protein